VSGLTCAVVFAERGYQTAIFAEETDSAQHRLRLLRFGFRMTPNQPML
jgi:hypothetical protein